MLILCGSEIIKYVDILIDTLSNETFNPLGIFRELAVLILIC